MDGKQIEYLLVGVILVLVVAECAALIFVAAVAVYQDIPAERVLIFYGVVC
jgi:hypothetical protein